MNPNIALQARGVQLQDPLESYGRAMSLKALIDQGAMQQLQARAAQLDLTEREKAIGRQEELRQVLSSSPDVKSALPKVYGIDPSTGMALDKHLRDQAKASTEQETAELKLRSEKAARLASIAGTMQDEVSYRRGVAMARHEKLIDDTVAQQLAGLAWSPETAAQVKQFQQQALTAHQQIEAARNATRDAAELPGMRAEAARKQLTMAGQSVSGISNQSQYDAWRAGLPAEIQGRIPAMFSPAAVRSVEALGMSPTERSAADDRDATRSLTAQQHADTLKQRELHHKQNMALILRGQNITAQGQRLTDAREREKMTRDTKEPTAGERHNLGFYLRARQADKSLEMFEQTIQEKGLLAQGYYKFAPNVIQTSDNQRYQQAQRAFTEARLRADSGAAIPDHEYANDAATYFPQPGDSTEVLEQKRAARYEVLRALKIGSGRAARDIGETPGDLPPRGSAGAGSERPNWQDFSFSNDLSKVSTDDLFNQLGRLSNGRTK